MTKTTIYHSNDWADLVETGWVTMFITRRSGIAVATMVYQPARLRKLER